MLLALGLRFAGRASAAETRATLGGKWRGGGAMRTQRVIGTHDLVSLATGIPHDHFRVPGHLLDVGESAQDHPCRTPKGFRMSGHELIEQGIEKEAAGGVVSGID
jgi:hypothetical protein